MPFGVVSGLGLHVLDGRAHWRHLANTVEGVCHKERRHGLFPNYFGQSYSKVPYYSIEESCKNIITIT